MFPNWPGGVGPNKFLVRIFLWARWLWRLKFLIEIFSFWEGFSKWWSLDDVLIAVGLLANQSASFKYQFENQPEFVLERVIFCFRTTGSSGGLSRVFSRKNSNFEFFERSAIIWSMSWAFCWVRPPLGAAELVDFLVLFSYWCSAANEPRYASEPVSESQSSIAFLMIYFIGQDNLAPFSK